MQMIHICLIFDQNSLFSIDSFYRFKPKIHVNEVRVPQLLVIIKVPTFVV